MVFVNTQNCDQCGARGMVPFQCETFTIENEGISVEVPTMSGWRCGVCGEVDFDTESTVRYANAGDAVVMAARKLAERG